MKNLNKIKDSVFQNAVEHGWHEEKHSCKHWCMLVITEIAEAVEADRLNRYADRQSYTDTVDYALHHDHLYGDDLKMTDDCAFNKYIKDSVEDELADVIIRLFDILGIYKYDFTNNIDPFQTIESDKALIRRIENESMTEFAYMCTQQVVQIQIESMWLGAIICLMHRIYLFSKIKGFDLEWHIQKKIAFNKNRSYKHNNKKY